MEDNVIPKKKPGRPRKVVKDAPLVKQESRDAVMKITLDMPDYGVSEHEITFVNIKGMLLASQRVPEVFMKAVKEKLKF